MKRTLFGDPSRAPGQPTLRRQASALVALSGLLLTVYPGRALPTVQTLAGGPTQAAPLRNYGYVDGDNATVVQFHTPTAVAVDATGNLLYIADRDNNAVRVLNINGKTTFTFATSGLSQPVGVALDSAGNVYVLSRGNGRVIEFDAFGDQLGVKASGLLNANGIAIDGITNIYVTAGNSVKRVSPSGFISTVVTIGGSTLEGVTVMDNGYLAVCDSARNGILLVNPANGTSTKLTGFNGAGDHFGPSGFAKFNQPCGIAAAGNGMLVVADCSNNRVKVVDPTGTVTNLFGVDSSFWVTGAGTYPGWFDGPVCAGDLNYNSFGCAEARFPSGVCVAQDGTVFDTEVFYHLIRQATSTGLTGPGPVGALPMFNQPMGLTLDHSGSFLFAADLGNNAVQSLNLQNNVTTNFLNANSGINQPVDVAFDANGNLLVLNQGSGSDGSILQFDPFGNLLTTIATGLALPTAFALDGSGGLFVTEQAGALKQFSGGTAKTLLTITNAGVRLEGITLFDDGTIAVSDAGNHVIWQIDQVTKAITRLTGQLGSPGNTLGSASFAKLNQPQQLARAGGNLIVVADAGNNRLAVVDRSGSITNALNSGNSQVWYGLPGDPYGTNSTRFVSMAGPVGAVVGGTGGVFDSEIQNNVIREILGSGLTPGGPGAIGGGGGGGGGSTNAIILPVLSPNTGYYPMGQIITVASPNPNVFYTTDGTDPTTNSHQVVMNGNVGFLNWYDSTNDLTGLRVKAFVGTNSSSVVVGQSATANNIGVPSAPTADGSIFAGIGSTVVIPVVVNLQTNAQIKSYQFRVEVTPTGLTTSSVSGFQTLAISTNDFVPLRTAATDNTTLSLGGLAYNIGSTKGLAISTVSGGNFSFQGFAVVALLQARIPTTAHEGDTYSIAVSYPSATSDGLSTAVPLAAQPPATILVTNVAYFIGDSASPSGTWYNAGGFGDGQLDNADVNNAFAAALGLHVPYPFSDAFNAMDAYPPDTIGFVGGDGQIRFLDWQLILQRSLALNTNNWSREWSLNGYLTNQVAATPFHALKGGQTPLNVSMGPWYRQAIVGAQPVGFAINAETVNVPVYVKLAQGATLSGLQFRAVVTAQNGAPPLAQPPVLNMAPGIPQPSLQQSFQPGEKAFGWSLGSFDFQPASSNFLGWLAFVVPALAQTGQGYLVSFASVDGAPDLNTQYNLETRSASVVVNSAAPPTSICSDDFKLHFFGSLADPHAADLADPDGDGMPNWMEYLAGTDPTDANSKLCFSTTRKGLVTGQPQLSIQWLTAPGKAYEVQSSPSLAGPWNTWQIVPGDGNVATCLETNATATARYYRLHLLP
jgi:sugar lactone lactonase YvrE